MVRRILTGDGHEVLVAGSAERALRLWLANRDSIDLVFTDLLMPGGMNGMELARAIRDDGSTVPIIVASGRSVDAGLDLVGVSFSGEAIRARRATSGGRDPICRLESSDAHRGPTFAPLLSRCSFKQSRRR